MKLLNEEITVHVCKVISKVKCRVEVGASEGYKMELSLTKA